MLGNGETIKARIVIGADGAYSKVSCLSMLKSPECNQTNPSFNSALILHSQLWAG